MNPFHHRPQKESIPMSSPSTEQTITVHLSRKQALDIRHLVMARLKFLRRTAQGEQESDLTTIEARERIRILGEFMNSINRYPQTKDSEPLPVHTFTSDKKDMKQLNEEVTLLYGLVRPKTLHTVTDMNVQETVTALSGWAHRGRSPEELDGSLSEYLSNN